MLGFKIDLYTPPFRMNATRSEQVFKKITILKFDRAIRSNAKICEHAATAHWVKNKNELQKT